MSVRQTDDTVATINAWSQTWADLVGAILWQSTLLVIAVAAVAFVMRRTSPRLRFWLWQIVAIKLLLMPFWTFAPTAAPPAVPGRADLLGLSWQSWLLGGWCVVVTLQISRLAWQRVRLSGLLERASPADGRVQQLVGDAAEKLGLRCNLRAVLTEFDCSPFVCGILQPVLVLPRDVLNSLDETQLRQVLLHEVAHVKERDLVWNWLPEIVRILYFFHPAAYYVNYRIRLEREVSCDQLAMSASAASAADYADTLVKVASHSSQPAALKAAAAHSG